MADLLRGFRCTLKVTQPFGYSGGWEWRYQLEGRDGAVEFWCRENPTPQHLDGRTHYGGFEIHRTTGEGAPDHGRCSALSERACWHDGSSTYGNEHWLPRWQRNPHDHEAIFRALAVEYRQRFVMGAAEGGETI